MAQISPLSPLRIRASAKPRLGRGANDLETSRHAEDNVPGGDVGLTHAVRAFEIQPPDSRPSGAVTPPGAFSLLHAQSDRPAYEPPRATYFGDVRIDNIRPLRPLPSRSYDRSLDGPPVAGSSATYRLADRQITLQQALPQLELFRSKRPFGSVSQVPQVPPQPTFSFERETLLAGVVRTVECTWAESGCRLRIPELGAIQIDGSGHFVSWTPRTGSSELDLQSLHDAVLEAGLVLALALQGAWCLRAGCLERHAPELPDGAEAVGFLGDGDAEANASMLAASLSGREPATRLRLASDTFLPWTLAPTPRAMPCFPQLRYPANRQPASLVARNLPLAELYCLETYEADEAREPRSPSEPISLRPQEALLALIRHTAYSTLFSQRLLARHFDDCTVAVRWLPISRLRCLAAHGDESRS